MIEIVPSILSADLGRLGEQARDALAAGARRIHVDVMDGHFVREIGMGPMVIEALRPIAVDYDATIEAHLMIDQPERHLAAFARAGAGCITVHVEACRSLHSTLALIRSLDARAGVALNPATPIVMLQEILTEVDLVLIMSVDPGASGQEFIPASLAKIARLRRVVERRGLERVAIEIDGGVHTDTVAGVARAGATLAVAGSGVFTGPRSVAENLAGLRAAADTPQASPIGRQARPSPASSG